jgi:hypothetical protein
MSRTPMIRVMALLALVGASSCVTTRSVPPLASARMVSDFETYEIRRVGLMPAAGLTLTLQQSEHMQAAFMAEFSSATDFEIVRLTPRDLEAIPRMEAHLRGRYSPDTVSAISRRYHLDALLIPTVTDLQTYPPQRLGVQVDLLSSETGQSLWESSVQLDAAQERVRQSIEVWADTHLGDVSDNTWELTLISPSRFARFAAYQMATLI